MASNLPKRQLNKSIEALKRKGINVSSSSFFHLSLFGNVIKSEKRLIQKLFLFLIEDNSYPVRHRFDDYICIEINAHFYNEYPYGAIYNHEGHLINTPENSVDKLERITINSSEIQKKKNFYHKNIDKTFFKSPSKAERVLYQYPYYLHRNNQFKTLIPINIITEHFFFNSSISSKAIYTILRDIKILEKIKSRNWEENKENRFITYPNNKEMFSSVKEFKSIFKYLFTISDQGEKAIEKLISYHHHSIRNENDNGFINTYLPYEEINLNLIGQFINEEKTIFHCYYIENVFPSENQEIYNVEGPKIKVPKLKNTNLDKPKNIRLKANNYESLNDIEISQETPYNPSSPGVDIIKESEPNQTLDFVPELGIEYILEENDENVFFALDSDEGIEFDSLTGNYDGSDSNSTAVQANIISEEISFEWDEIMIQTLLEICEENNYKGYFLYIDSATNNSKRIDYKNYENQNVFSIMPNKNSSNFRFLLFRFEALNKNYYFLDRGKGKYCAIFKSEANIILSINNIKRILTITYSDKYNGNWTSKSLKKKLYELDIRILVYKAMMHSSIKSDNNDNQALINSLKKRILQRINANPFLLKPL